MVVIKEFHPCQRDYVFKYAEQKRIEKEVERKISELHDTFSQEIPIEQIPDTKTRSLISSTIDFAKFLRETEQHLIEAKHFGYEITSIHNAVQNLNNLKSSELLERLKAGNAEVSKLQDDKQEVERYANGTIHDETFMFKRRMGSPVSIATIEEYKLHGRIGTPDFDYYHSSKKTDKNVKNSDSYGSNFSYSSSENEISDKLSHKVEKKVTIPEKKPISQSFRSKIKDARIPACPPKVKEMLDQVKQRKNSKRVAIPISVLNLRLV